LPSKFLYKPLNVTIADIRLISDYVDPEFGTGAVKITPAHDFNDFNLGKAHNLPFINIMNDDGTLNENAGKYAGKGRWDTRYEVTAELEKLGLLVKKEDNPMKVPICNRSSDVVEPLIKPQWWMKMDSLAEEALKVVRNGEIKIRPESAEKNYYRWLESIQDWCLSRQLYWGHQIPAYFVHFEGEQAGDQADDALWITGRTPEEAQAKAEQKWPGKKFTLKRDEDVLDTWYDFPQLIHQLRLTRVGFPRVFGHSLHWDGRRKPTTWRLSSQHPPWRRDGISFSSGWRE